VIAEEAGSRAGGELLAVDGLTVRLGGRQVLDEVTFDVREGELTGLIGPNGAGKTTLLKAVLGFLDPSAGAIRVGGRSRRRRGQAIGYVPQRISLDPDVPVRARDLVALGIDGQRYGIGLRSASRTQRVEEMLAAVGAGHLGDGRIGELSGGEQQRVLIAHALVSRPRLLLLDEPLANLDLRSENEIVELLGRIAHEQHIAVLLSAHEMNPLLAVMDRIVYLAGGRAASGTTAEVVRTEVLTELYGHRVDVVEVNGRILVVAGRGGSDHHGHVDDPALRWS
jgi:zinc/manganese transport system ATP-binding protein